MTRSASTTLAAVDALSPMAIRSSLPEAADRNDSSGVDPPEVDDLVALAAKNVGEHRGRQSMRVTRSGADHHGASMPAATREPRPHAADDPRGDGRSAVLLLDREPTVGPAVSDLVQRRTEHADVELRWLRSPDQRSLEDLPRPGFVALDEPITQSVRMLRPPWPPAGRPRPGRGPAEVVEILTAHPPLAAFAPSRQLPGAHVPVGGHVVDAETLGHVVQ